MSSKNTEVNKRIEVPSHPLECTSIRFLENPTVTFVASSFQQRASSLVLHSRVYQMQQPPPLGCSADVTTVAPYSLRSRSAFCRPREHEVSSRGIRNLQTSNGLFKR